MERKPVGLLSAAGRMGLSVEPWKKLPYCWTVKRTGRTVGSIFWYPNVQFWGYGGAESDFYGTAEEALRAMLGRTRK